MHGLTFPLICIHFFLLSFLRLSVAGLWVHKRTCFQERSTWQLPTLVSPGIVLPYRQNHIQFAVLLCVCVCVNFDRWKSSLIAYRSVPRLCFGLGMCLSLNAFSSSGLVSYLGSESECCCRARLEVDVITSFLEHDCSLLWKSCSPVIFSVTVTWLIELCGS